jgi:heme oxygenase
MATLRELTQASHDAIEELPLNKSIFDGSITEKQWTLLLHQKYHLYKYIESRIELPENLRREERLFEDCNKLPRVLLGATHKYLEHLQSLDDAAIWGHLYVHYMGELFGGQMLKKMVPYENKSHMDFESRKELVDYMRAELAGREEELADEANLGFKLSMDLYDEIFRVTQTSQ